MRGRKRKATSRGCALLCYAAPLLALVWPHLEPHRLLAQLRREGAEEMVGLCRAADSLKAAALPKALGAVPGRERNPRITLPLTLGSRASHLLSTGREADGLAERPPQLSKAQRRSACSRSLLRGSKTSGGIDHRVAGSGLELDGSLKDVNQERIW